MFKYFVKRQHREKVKAIIDFKGREVGYPYPTILKEQEVLKLINLGVLNEYCFKVPYSFKVGDYVTCVREQSFDLTDFHSGSDYDFTNTKKYLGWKENKTLRVNRIGALGATLFFDNGEGVYLNWVRPATEEEIKNCK